MSSSDPRELSAADKQTLVLKRYEALRVLADEMLELARAETWNELIQQQARYVVEVERLSRMEQDLTFDAMGRERKATLLEAILESEREMRERLVARRDELGELIGSSQRKRDLSRAYRTGSGHNVVDAEHAFAVDPSRKSPGTP
ncbi:flagellar protein FliT [Franzmannia pantelleriensis]|uniref:Flagellar protein FliT n=1 Tax=Franzmannia pantelleriensis TaxID=48727 RepID=A0A1G9ELX2_9GAMM|nr:flagellar protein FliT [Halomonas pantelleriensis]SDK77088.1 flagellar protein FliT [Halomonas pantelleriensis]